MAWPKKNGSPRDWRDPTAEAMAEDLASCPQQFNLMQVLADRLDELAVAPDFAYALRWLSARRRHPGLFTGQTKSYIWRFDLVGPPTQAPYCFFDMPILRAMVGCGRYEQAYKTWYDAVLRLSVVLGRLRREAAIQPP